MSNLPLLSLIVLTPAVGGIILMFLDRKYVRELRQGALIVSGVTLLLALGMLIEFDGSKSTMQLEENHTWIDFGYKVAVGEEGSEELRSLKVGYHLGVDGISVLLVLLTAGLMPFTLLSTWRAVEKRAKEFCICILMLESGMLGVFLALDLVLFYLFWEVMLIPMYLLIGVWGGERRIYAAIKFFIYTMVGSLLMLLAIVWMGVQTGTFDISDLNGGSFTRQAQIWLFAAFGLSFAIKVPMFPFHTWLPDAHVEAPTAGSVILAGVLLKMGTYGFLRFCLPIFPMATLAYVPWIMWLSIIAIIFGACMALVQNDIKKLVAYSSVSHMGFITLGIFALNKTAVAGSILQMVNHGLSTSMLFLLIGIIYERRHTRELSAYGGIAKVVPIYAVFVMLATLSSVGLPGLNGFVGEFLIMLGAFQNSPLYGVLCATGVILGAVYLLRMVKKFLFGPVVHAENENLKDCTAREIVYLTPFVAMMVWIGLYPKPFLNLIEPTVQALLEKTAF